MRALALVLLLALAAPAGAANPLPPRPQPDPSITDGSAQRALDRARTRWRRAGIHNYRFALKVIASGGWDDSPSYPTYHGDPAEPVFFVRNDRPLKADARWRKVATVKRLHKLVQHLIDEGVADLRVRYTRRGIPRRIAVDPSAAVDDELTYLVDHFWRGTRGRGGPSMP
jgi:hypothetical protein